MTDAMTERHAATDDPRARYQVMGIITGATVVLNIAFYFLSQRYFDDRVAMYGAVTPEHMTSVRAAFATFTGATMFGALAATWSPRVVGHGLAGLAGLVALVAGVSAFRSGLHPVLGITLLTVGGVLPFLVRSSLLGSRASWSFLAATCSVLALVTLFGATKIRVAVGLSLWHSMIIPGLFLVATAALAMIRTSYRDA